MGIYTLRDHIYDSNITFLFGMERDDVVKFLKENLKDCENDFSELYDNTYGFIAHPAIGTDYFLVLNKNIVHWEATLAHEGFHITCNVMRYADIKLGKNSEEAFAYYLTWLVREFSHAYKSKKSKGDKK